MMYKGYIVKSNSLDNFRIVFDDMFECVGLWQNDYINVHYYKNGDVYNTYTFISENINNNIYKAINYYEKEILNLYT